MVLSRQVPQRLVKTGKSAHQHIAAAKESGAVDVLPVVLYAQRVLADQVITQFLDGGRVVEDGAPDDLVARNGRYAALHRAWIDSLA